MKVSKWLVVVLLACVTAGAAAQTLERIKEGGIFRIGYRLDAPPFSYRNAIGEPAGYAVDLCREVAAHTRQALNMAQFEVQYVPVTAEDRFDAVANGRVDILCGPTSATLPRRELVDFSLPTFIDGASVMYHVDGPAGFEELNGRRVGVRKGTTTEEALNNTMKTLGIEAEIVAVEDHADGVRQLDAGAISAYFADRAILEYLRASSEQPEKLRVSNRYFTHEPYALAITRGDDDFRLVVDRALSRTYASGRIELIFRRSFGTVAQPGELLKALYIINVLPE